MNWYRAIEMMENGEAEMVALTAVVIKACDKVWLSFDGQEWEETESNLIKKQV